MKTMYLMISVILFSGCVSEQYKEYTKTGLLEIASFYKQKREEKNELNQIQREFNQNLIDSLECREHYPVGSYKISECVEEKKRRRNF